MTATPAFASRRYPARSRRAHAHGIDLLVMRLSMAALLWARRRADRADLGRDDLVRLRQQSAAIEQREHESALLAARVR